MSLKLFFRSEEDINSLKQTHRMRDRMSFPRVVPIALIPGRRRIGNQIAAIEWIIRAFALH